MKPKESPKSEARGKRRLIRVCFRLRTSDFGLRTLTTCFLFLAFPLLAAPLPEPFQTGALAYRTAQYSDAAHAFRQAARQQPASGTLQNLGNAEWQCGQTGPAVLAWEQALWINPFNAPAQNNLRFARKTAQLETPDLVWYEVVSTWLPANVWAWIAGGSLWLTVALVLLPGIFRWRKATWHQAVAALSLMVFLLSLPAHAGIYTRSRLGFILQKDVPLRLTPTDTAQTLSRLPAGQYARCEKVHGKYLLIRAGRTDAKGWIDRTQFGFIQSPQP
jgi:hypothetical protein